MSHPVTPGTTAVVTGASSGIGAAIATELAARGSEVIGLARRFTATGPGLRGEAGVRPVHCDVAESGEVARVFETVEHVDWLVCAAGGGAFGPAVNADASVLRELLDAHIVGTYNCVRAVLPAMQAAARGVIVVIGSIAETRALADCALYSAAKAGQSALMGVIAEESRPFGIRVVRVRVGAVDTAMWEDRPGFDRSRMMKPADVARSIVDAVLAPGVSVEEITLLPSDGVMSAAVTV